MDKYVIKAIYGIIRGGGDCVALSGNEYCIEKEHKIRNLMLLILLICFL